MPHLFSFASHANDDALQELGHVEQSTKHLRRHSLLRRPLSLLKRQHGDPHEVPSPPATAPTELADLQEYFLPRRPSLPEVVVAKKAVPSLPRPQTFCRQESERRERLLEVQTTVNEKRAFSAERRPLQASASPDNEVSGTSPADPSSHGHVDRDVPTSEVISSHKSSRKELPPLLAVDDPDQNKLTNDEKEWRDDEADNTSLHEEFQRRWILNLSMHFRDKSNREKFFVTFAEKPNQWRRLTISLDYRNAPEESLEADLSTLHFQRDKNFHIYEAIRESLPEIQYYDSVTNLKLETTPDDGQLHVHVREDANEIIQYPSRSLFDHVRCPRFGESSLEFLSHLSGFVYKVRLGGRIVIKKEIPGPDTVDEFLYEVNALDSLLGVDNVVQLEGLVTDDRGELVKGLLISYASEGSLVDMIYDFKGTTQLPWYRREKWAKQIVAGLAEIHEAGFVQGDFTLSNIVIDADDNAQIIDINRRGCPVGWEPPELGRLIDSGQRIGMCIGVKTDLYQLGMCLWALAEETDEPERVDRPLPAVLDSIPDYFRELVEMCLSERPQRRIGAKQLLRLFPDNAGLASTSERTPLHEMQLPSHSDSTSTHRSAKEYIDPELAVTIDEVQDRQRLKGDSSAIVDEQVTYINPASLAASSTYHFGSSGSWIVGTRSRGRSPVSSRRRRSSPYGRAASSATSFSEVIPLERSIVDDGSDRDLTSRSQCCSAPTPAPSQPAVHIERRVAALPSHTTERFAGLIHVDSGFDEAIPDEVDLDNSCLTEMGVGRRAKTYVPDDDGSSDEELIAPSQRLHAPRHAHDEVDHTAPDCSLLSVSVDFERRASA